MAKPGETPSPAAKRGSGNEQLPYGAAEQIANLERAVPSLQEPNHVDPLADHNPSSTEERFILGPTDRPNEPLTQGAPFGPGANYTPYSYESDQQFMLRVASDIAAQPDATPAVRSFLARVQAGE